MGTAAPDQKLLPEWQLLLSWPLATQYAAMVEDKHTQCDIEQVVLRSGFFAVGKCDGGCARQFKSICATYKHRIGAVEPHTTPVGLWASADHLAAARLFAPQGLFDTNTLRNLAPEQHQQEIASSSRMAAGIEQVLLQRLAEQGAIADSRVFASELQEDHLKVVGVIKSLEMAEMITVKVSVFMGGRVGEGRHGVY